MRRTILSLGVALALVVLLFSAVAIGQATTPLARLQPLLLEVAQSVPLTLTIAVPSSPTETITVTVPAVVDLNIAIRLTSGLTPVVEVAPAVPAKVTVSVPITGQENIDDLGIPYTMIQGDKDIWVAEWTTFESEYGQLTISGEVVVQPDARSFNSVDFVIRLFNDKGKLLDVEDGSAFFGISKPGDSQRFKISGFTDTKDIDHYTVEVFVRQ